MNRREFLKLIPALIGAAIAPMIKINPVDGKKIDCGTSKTIGMLPSDATVETGEIWNTENGEMWWVCQSDGDIYISLDNGLTFDKL